MKLSELNQGKIAFINKVNGNSAFTKRLKALGCIEGAEIIVKTKAPLGDPIMVDLRGSLIAIRKKDAKYIEISEG